MAETLATQIRVVLAYSPAPREVREIVLNVLHGTTALQALRASGLLALFPELSEASCTPGIWGRKVEWGQTLQDQDRLELYRPLKVDPKLARRERFRKQGVRGTGLFARKPPTDKRN